MFKGTRSQGDLNGFLDAGSHMKGELSFEDTFRIDGKLTGSVVSDGDLIVGDQGDVDGEIRVRRVYISGVVRGKVETSERVEITENGRVMADLSTPALTIEEGAFFEGQCAMKQHPSAKIKEKPDRDKVAQMPIARKGTPA